MAEPANLISVRSDVAASLLIDGLFDEAVGRLGDELAVSTGISLARSADTRVARLGYHARIIELERFEVARTPSPWLIEHLVDGFEDSIGEISMSLASAEPLGKSAPADGSPAWRIPGPGGHVRHFLALRAIGAGPPELKRDWMFGFMLRCCEDAADAPVKCGP